MIQHVEIRLSSIKIVPGGEKNATTGKNIYLRKDRWWERRFIKDRIGGKLHYGYAFGKTYEDAERKLNAISLENRISTCENKCSFARLANEWLLLRTPQLKASSVAKYTNMLNLYLLPSFGNKQIFSISRTEIVQLSRELLTTGGAKATGLSPKTVNSVLSLAKNHSKKP